MKYLFLFLSLAICAQSQEIFEIYPGLQLRLSGDRRLAYPVHEGQMIYYKSKDILAVIIITKIENGTAEYKVRIFSISERKESKLAGKLEEAYEKVKLPNGDVEVIDKGSHLTINLKYGGLQWSFGEKGKCYVYQKVDESKLFVLDADYFDDCVLGDEKRDK
jgi:hypothetical protein